MTERDDLNAEQRKAFDTWVAVGLTESAAMDALREDGVIQLSEADQLARTFRETWGLGEAAAEIAARGRDGGSFGRQVSEIQLARQAEDRQRLITLIEAWAEDLLAGGGGGLCIERGETKELASLRAAYGKALLAARNHTEAAWVIGVVGSWRPELLDRPGSKGG